MKILLITEQRDATWNKVSFETLAAAQQIVQQTKGTLRGVVIGKGIGALAADLSAYQVRDFAPKLAASLHKGMIGDCIAYRYEDGKLIFVRQMFQGRTSADVVFVGEGPWIASFQASAFRADLATKHASGTAPVKSVSVELKPEQIRTKPLDLFREAKQVVDLTQAPILVSVGRGIKAPENIPLAEKLAKLM